MNNYRSKQLPKISESIVYSFDLVKNSEQLSCEQLSFGVSSSGDKKTIDQNIYIFKNIPYWHNDISQDISCLIDKDNKTDNITITLTNCGEKLLNKSFLIFNPSINSTINNLSTSSLFDCQFYIEEENTSNKDITIHYNNKDYKKDSINIEPLIATNKIFINNVQFSKDDDYWLFLDNDTLLCLDYEFSFNSKNENFIASTILPMVNNKIENFYYTNKIPNKNCRIRFIIDDKGRYIAVACSNETLSNNYNKSDSFIFSNNYVLEQLEKNKKDNVSVRFSIDNKNCCTNLSSNF